jgi:hypothetical protein
MRFSEAFEVGPTNNDDWFDLVLNVDSNFCIDPFLIYQDDSGFWSTAHAHLLEFFAMAFDCVRRARGKKDSTPWRVAQNLMLFLNPAEFCLGVAATSPLGSGAGPGLQKEMLDSISAALNHGLDNVPHLEYLAVLAGGIGYDRLSDMTCNILKSFFIRYTQEICTRHRIPTSKVRVVNANWNSEHYFWQPKDVHLPINPTVTSQELPILLTPEAFLRDIPVATAEKFWGYAQGAAELRDRFNFDLSRNASRYLRAKIARANIPLVDRYFETLEQQRHEPYSLEDDPKRRLNPGETREALLAQFPDTTLPHDQDGIPQFVEALVRNFAYTIEQKGIWRALWYKGRGREEKIAQWLFYAMVIMFCRSHNIDVTPESNAGQRPVDFKFSQGWQDRALVELKLVRNSAFWDGVMQQTPAYARSEEIHSAFFVAIAYTDDEMNLASKTKVENAAARASERNGLDIKSVIIDARQQLSASKLRSATGKGTTPGGDGAKKETQPESG